MSVACLRRGPSQVLCYMNIILVRRTDGWMDSCMTAMIFVARNFAMIVEIDLRAKLSDILIKRGAIVGPSLPPFFHGHSNIRSDKLAQIRRAFHFLVRDPSRFGVEGARRERRREGGREGGRATAKV